MYTYADSEWSRSGAAYAVSLFSNLYKSDKIMPCMENVSILPFICPSHSLSMTQYQQLVIFLWNLRQEFCIKHCQSRVSFLLTRSVTVKFYLGVKINLYL